MSDMFLLYIHTLIAIQYFGAARHRSDGGETPRGSQRDGEIGAQAHFEVGRNIYL